jgi:hypothetical protein
MHLTTSGRDSGVTRSAAVVRRGPNSSAFGACDDACGGNNIISATAQNTRHEACPSVFTAFISSGSHEAVTHVLQLLRNFSRRFIQFVRDLLLFGSVQDVEAFAPATTASAGSKRERKGGWVESLRGRVQVSVDDILDGHVVGAVHQMVAADNAVRLLADVPAQRVGVDSKEISHGWHVTAVLLLMMVAAMTLRSKSCAQPCKPRTFPNE